MLLIPCENRDAYHPKATSVDIVHLEKTCCYPYIKHGVSFPLNYKRWLVFKFEELT
jgi:hypothetical protein